MSAPETHGGGRSGASTREKIIDAAAHVMRTLGLARATTKEIAGAAGYSEATLYKHFPDKEQLFICVLRERLPGFVEGVKQLPDRAGEGTIEGQLEQLARQAVAFYTEGMPMSASLFAEPELLAGHREGLRRAGAGPQRAIELLAAYLRAEQRLGRLAPHTNPEAGAALLLGACYQRAFLITFMGRDVLGQSDDRFATEVVRTLLHGLDT